MKTKYKFSKRSLDNLEGVHPKLVEVMKAAITDSTVDFTITEGLRTLKRQQELYAQGRTKKGNIVTNADGVKNKSNHQAKSDGYGYAVDLYPYFFGQVQVNHKDTIERLKDISKHIKGVAKELNIPIVWGGDWKSPYDPPHWELNVK
jgi:peptidoglycan L-alanyl-D-glutamate endopeptidase CwlK